MNKYQSDVSNITNRLREIRRSMGWSLETAAEKVGIPTPVIGSWERGNRRPPINSAQFWAERFGCRLVLLEPGQYVVGALPTASSWVEIVVDYGPDVIVCTSREEADEIASRMPGSQVKWRKHTVSELQEVDE